MGMSASQARLIALNSRMSDIEYQGQQINQQRTTLSNQINALYNTLLDMSVPTPPSVSDFTKIQYTGIDGAATFTLGNITPSGQNDEGKQTYSVQINSVQTGHSMAASNYDSVVTNTADKIKFSSVPNDVLYRDSRLFVKTETPYNYRELGESVTSVGIPCSSEEAGNDVVIKMSAAQYAGIKDSITASNTVYQMNEKGQLEALKEGETPKGDVYVKVNLSELNDESNTGLRSLAGYTPEAVGEGETPSSATLSNVYEITDEDKQGVNTTYSDSSFADNTIPSLGYYSLVHTTEKRDGKDVEVDVFVPITSLEGLKQAMASGTVIQKDSTGDIELDNPNAKEGGTGRAVGDKDLYDLKTAVPDLMSQQAWTDYITAIRHSIDIPNFDKETASNDAIADKFYVYFTKDGDKQVPHFVMKADVESIVGQKAATTYEYDAAGKYTEKQTKQDCQLKFDASTGRVTQIGYPDPVNPEQFHWVEVSAETVTDEDAYKEAFNQYEFKKYEYDQKQQEINVKTSIIQAEDKNLELKLTRLDNERNAVKTEIDAVKKVVDENIEKSFKTFSG